MKIAFWNGVNYTTGQPDYVAAVGVALTLVHGYNVVMSSNHISNHMLQDCFSVQIPKAGSAREPCRLYYSAPEYHRRLLELKRCRRGAIQEVPMEGIMIVYPPDADEEVFYFEISANTFYLVDIVGENYAVSQRALENAELIILFLPPDEEEIRLFFRCFSMLISHSIIVIDGFMKMSPSFLNFLELKYGIKKDNIIIIPENSEFVEACENGKLDYFMKDNILGSASASNALFLNSIRQIVRAICKACIEGEYGKGEQDEE